MAKKSKKVEVEVVEEVKEEVVEVPETNFELHLDVDPNDPRV